MTAPFYIVNAPPNEYISSVFSTGTGSGLGTYVLRLLEDEFPDVYRFNVPVYPSSDDDVITSPYNCVLATKQLTDRADCVMPVENQVEITIVVFSCDFFDYCGFTSSTDSLKQWF